MNFYPAHKCSSYLIFTYESDNVVNEISTVIVSYSPQVHCKMEAFVLQFTNRIIGRDI